MNNYKRGFVPLIAVLVAVGVIVLAGGLYVEQKKSAPKAEVSENRQDVSTTTNQQVGAKISEVTFDSPYPVVWKTSPPSSVGSYQDDYIVDMALSGVSVGRVDAFTLPTSPLAKQSLLFDKDGKNIEAGKKVYAAVLHLKISNGTGRNKIVPLQIRRVVNEDGDMVAPNMRQFYFSKGGSGIQSQETLFDQKVYFLVPENEKEFIFNTGGSPRITFSVRVQEDGSIQVTKENTEIIPPIKVPSLIQQESALSTQACQGPYRKLVGSQCVWQCGAGTTPDYTKNECKCLTGYTDGSKDSFGRKTCSAPPAPVISWTQPKSAVTVTRGESFDLAWSASGSSPLYRSIGFTLRDASSLAQKDAAYFNISAGMGKFKVTAPAGQYVLKMSIPQNTYSTVPVTVLPGQPAKPDPQESSFDFDAYSDWYTDEIIADGKCKAVVLVEVYDQYGDVMSGKKVSVVSSRGESDTILPQSLVTDEDGGMNFSILSQAIGTATLRAYVDGVQIGDSITLDIKDPKNNECPN